MAKIMGIREINKHIARTVRAGYIDTMARIDAVNPHSVCTPTHESWERGALVARMDALVIAIRNGSDDNGVLLARAENLLIEAANLILEEQYAP